MSKIDWIVKLHKVNVKHNDVLMWLMIAVISIGFLWLYFELGNLA